jgi:CpeT/CpcT family (DUF1001)
VIQRNFKGFWRIDHPAVTMGMGMSALSAIGVWTIAHQPAIAQALPPQPSQSLEQLSLDQLSLDQQAELVAQRLTGILSTQEQAQQSPGKPAVQMTTCRLPAPDASPASEIWLYQEQAVLPDLTKPYRQRLLRISPSPYSKTVRSQSYKLAQPERWINYCDRDRANQSPAQSPALPQEVLTQPPLCQVYLKPVGPDFIGNTPPTGCPTTARGAVRITNHIILRPTSMTTWDRGFDASGKQLWGARGEAYQFRKI